MAKWPSVTALPAAQRFVSIKLLRGLQQYGGFWGDRSGGGTVDGCHPASVAQGTQYGSGYKFPVPVVPRDLIPHLRVIDWTKWTGA